MTDFIAFMAHLPHDQIDYVEEQIKHYKSIDGKYIIGMEDCSSIGQHMHFYVQMKDKDYKSFAQKLFRDKYKLRGRAEGGCARQYGKEKNIRDNEKMASYTVKDNNIRTNFEEEELRKIFEGSFKKEKKKSKDMITKELKEYLREVERDNKDKLYIEQELKAGVCRYHMINNTRWCLTAAYVQRVTSLFISYDSSRGFEDRIQEIYNICKVHT